uniref:Proteasome subunit beta n=1 Tax=Chaetoceros debilis TaxID=122233 RepID=A0A7S3VDU1_9STRA
MFPKIILSMSLGLGFFTLIPIAFTTAKFEPYALNGGLVSAVAGKDYVIIASDTRMTDGGYSIMTRDYMTSRIWDATGVSSSASSSSLDGDDNDNGNGNPYGGGLNSDGSLVIPKKEASVPASYEIDENDINEGISIKTSFTQCPTFIASAGCASDCEALKRKMRSEISAHKYWNHGAGTLTPSGIANLLMMTLYSRRTFPFYSFCILAGLDASPSPSLDEHGDEDENENEDGNAHVHVYDAIGSHERVAVASAGNGREMLQPILDRLFATGTEAEADGEIEIANSKKSKLNRDDRAIHPSEQRVGLKLLPPVETYVKCNEREAVGMLVRGYRSVAEREISIGDNVVVCVLKRHWRGTGTTRFETEVLRFPLKKH